MAIRPSRRKIRRRPRGGKKFRKRKGLSRFRKFERELDKFSKQMLEDLQQEVIRSLIPRINLLAESAKKPRIVVLDQIDDGVSMNDLIDQIESQFLGFYSKEQISGFLKGFYSDIGIQNDNDINAEFARQNLAIGPSAEQQVIIENTVADVTNRFRNLQQNVIGDIRGEIQKGIQNGDRWETVARRLQKSITAPKGSESPTAFKKAVNRAKFIARNTVSETLGELNKDRQTSAGVELYEWQTAEDERVRPTHVKLGLDGKNIFSWSGTVVVDGVEYREAIDPDFSGSGTQPGQPWNCRCVAIPFIPELDE